MDVHPLIFQPILRPKVWGGRALADRLGKSLPADVAVGESLECADLPGAQCVVADGPSKGRTLGQLTAEWGAALTGRAPLADGRFPLLIKFLDARHPLSIQVHPGPRMLAERGAGCGLKHEAWYVIDAAPDAFVYRGLRPGVTPDQLRAAAGTPAVVDLLNRVPVKAGHCLYCPGGTVHSLGAGLLVAEVQTPSDVTYRLYDWGRERPAADAGLHLDAAMEAIEWTQPSDPRAVRRSHVGGLFTTVTRLVDCAAFRVEKVRFVEGMEQDMPYAEMVAWIVLEGRGEVLHGGARGGSRGFARGDVVVLPAALRNGRIRTHTDCTWLEVTVPVVSDLSQFDRPSAEALRSDDRSQRGLVPLNIATSQSGRDASPRG